MKYTQKKLMQIKPNGSGSIRPSVLFSETIRIQNIDLTIRYKGDEMIFKSCSCSYQVGRMYTATGMQKAIQIPQKMQ